jgi:hypothetical protein
MSQTREEFADDGDEVIARVREARRRISARFDHDPAKLVAHYMERQKQHRGRLIGAPETVEEPDQSAA